MGMEEGGERGERNEQVEEKKDNKRRKTGGEGREKKKTEKERKGQEPLWPFRVAFGVGGLNLTNTPTCPRCWRGRFFCFLVSFFIFFGFFFFFSVLSLPPGCCLGVGGGGDVWWGGGRGGGSRGRQDSRALKGPRRPGPRRRPPGPGRTSVERSGPPRTSGVFLGGAAATPPLAATTKVAAAIVWREERKRRRKNCLCMEALLDRELGPLHGTRPARGHLMDLTSRGLQRDVLDASLRFAKGLGAEVVVCHAGHAWERATPGTTWGSSSPRSGGPCGQQETWRKSSA
jgi:hypothetical protein